MYYTNLVMEKIRTRDVKAKNAAKQFLEEGKVSNEREAGYLEEMYKTIWDYVEKIKEDRQSEYF